MLIETLSVFPQMFHEVMSTSIPAIAQRKGALEFRAHDLRDWTHDRHRSTDDQIYGGGQGLLMMCPPIFEALDELERRAPDPAAMKVIFFTPTGVPFDQALATQLACEQHLVMVCGRYEGFDERVYTRADLCISLGDYILSGGELAAMVVTDAISRLLPGVLGDEGSAVEESFSEGLLEFPQYTRPASYRGLDVPEVLLSGNHAMIDAWRRRESIRKTALLRPDLLEHVCLTDEEKDFAYGIIEAASTSGDDCYDGQSGSNAKVERTTDGD